MNKINNNNNKNNHKYNFIENYQKVVDNYTNAIKYYINNINIINALNKIINAYKENIIAYRKKLIQIKSDLIKPFYNEDQQAFKYKEKIYSFNNQFLFKLNHLITFQINCISNIISDIETKVFKEKINNNFINILQQNKNNLQNNQKKIEKIYNEYDTEYQKIQKKFCSIEEDIQRFYIKKKMKVDEETKKDYFNKFLIKGKEAQNIFYKFQDKFKDNNKAFFDLYNENMKEFEKEIIKNENYIDDNINLFFLTLINNINLFLDSLTDIKENKETSDLIPKKYINIINNNINAIKERKVSDCYNIFIKKNLLKFETNYEKEKYKIKTIQLISIKDFLPSGGKNILKEFDEEFGLDDENDPYDFIFPEEDIYSITEFFYNSFDFVDKTEYDLILEKNKLEIKKLVNKLLQPGLIKTKFEEYKGLLPINDEEIKILSDYIGKNREYRNSFLLRINNFRTFGNLSLPEREYELLGNYFSQILDCTFKEKSEEDFNIIKNAIIMSQTFYFYKNEEKIYLINKIKGHKLFLEAEYFSKYLKYYINENIYNSNKNEIVKASLEHKDDIIFSHILPFFNYMNQLDVPIELIKKIIDSIDAEFKFSAKLKNNIKLLNNQYGK